MTNQLTKAYRLIAIKGVFFQTIIAFMLVMLIFIGWGVKESISSFLGSLVSIIPSIVYGFYAFRFVGADKTEQVYNSLKRGNVLKFMLTIVLFALILKNEMVLVLPFFCSYVLVLFSGLFAPLFMNKRHK